MIDPKDYPRAARITIQLPQGKSDLRVEITLVDGRVGVAGRSDSEVEWALYDAYESALDANVDDVNTAESGKGNGHPHPDVKTYRLGYGYYLRPDRPLPDGRDVVDGKAGWCMDWVVTRSRDVDDEQGRKIEASCSLTCAQQMGEMHHHRNGMEEEIPQKVLDKMEEIVSKLESAKLA